MHRLERRRQLFLEVGAAEELLTGSLPLPLLEEELQERPFRGYAVAHNWRLAEVALQRRSRGIQLAAWHAVRA